MDWIATQLDGIITGAVLMWLVAAFAYALPAPTDADGKWYVIVYRLVHFFGANIDRMKQGKLPAPQARTPGS